MPQVPYSPVPTRSPTGPDAPEFRISTPPEAFGVNVAQAVEHLSGVEGQVGNELFQRAEAMQNLKNESEAREADAQYMQQVGDLHAKFSALSGKAASDAYPQYQADLNNLRTQIRDGLSNDAARRMYDASSLSTMGRTIFNGAGHAGEQLKQYAKGAVVARIKSLNDQVLSFPNSDEDFKRLDAVTEAEIRRLGAGSMEGWSPEQIELKVSQGRSELYSSRIKGIAQTNPWRANDLMKDAINEGHLQGEDIANTQKVVYSQMANTGARNISRDIMSGRDSILAENKVPIEQAKMAIAKVEGGDYSARGKMTRHGRALGKYQVMEEYLPGFLAEAGMQQMTPDQFLADHNAQEQLFTAIFGGYMQKYGSFADAAAKWFTGKSRDEGAFNAPPDAMGTSPNAYVQMAVGALSRNMPLAQRVAAARQRAQELAPEVPQVEDAAVARVDQDYNVQRKSEIDAEFANRNTVEGGIIGAFNGKLPTNVDELRALDPKVADAWDQLDNIKKKQFLDQMAKNAKGDVGWTQEGLAKWAQLRGMAGEAPSQFLDQNILDQNIPRAAKMELIRLQQRVQQGISEDPSVTKAMTQLAPLMAGAQISRARDENRYFQFRGSLQDALHEWAQEHNGKRPNSDEIQEIGKRLLRQVSFPGRWWGTNEYPLIDVPVPNEEHDKIVEAYKADNNGTEPTDLQIHQFYVRKLYRSFIQRANSERIH